MNEINIWHPHARFGQMGLDSIYSVSSKHHRFQPSMLDQPKQPSFLAFCTNKTMLWAMTWDHNITIKVLHIHNNKEGGICRDQSSKWVVPSYFGWGLGEANP